MGTHSFFFSLSLSPSLSLSCWHINLKFITQSKVVIFPNVCCCCAGGGAAQTVLGSLCVCVCVKFQIENLTQAHKHTHSEWGTLRRRRRAFSPEPLADYWGFKLFIYSLSTRPLCTDAAVPSSTPSPPPPPPLPPPLTPVPVIIAS